MKPARSPLWWLGLTAESGAALGYMALIFWASSGPTTIPFQQNVPHVDKLLHLAAYAVLGVLLCLPSHRLTRSIFWSAWFAVLAAGLYGLSDEIHQSFVPGRSDDLYDLIADMAGGLIGGLVWAWWQHYRNKRTHEREGMT